MPWKLLHYAGLATWNKASYRTGSKQWNSSANWKLVENAHPAIITLDQAEAIHALREGRKCRPGKRGKRPTPYVLTGGLLKCSRCEANLAGRAKRGTGYYVCGSEIYRHGAGCGKPAWYIRQENADAAAFDCIERVLASDSKHTRRIVQRYNAWVDSQLSLYGSASDARLKEIERLKAEIAKLTESIAAGVDAATLRSAINERASHLERLQGIGDAELPRKIEAFDLDSQARIVREIAQSRDPETKRPAIRRYVAAMLADPERRAITVQMRPLSLICGHSVAAPTGVEPVLRP